MRKFSESSFIARSLFDCAELFESMPEMKMALAQMEKFSENSKSIKSAYHIRTALFYAYENKPSDFIDHYIDSINGLNDEAKRRIKRKAFLIRNRKF